MSYQNQNYGYNGYGQAGYNSQAEQQNTSTSTSGTPLGWDDEVEEKSFILLPEGEYPVPGGKLRSRTVQRISEDAAMQYS